jgi:hypothetical protein
MDIKKIKKKVNGYSLNKIKSMAENSFEDYREYKAREKSPITNKYIVRECLIVLRLCKDIEELINGKA